jgi:hypothetical protein
MAQLTYGRDTPAILVVTRIEGEKISQGRNALQAQDASEELRSPRPHTRKHLGAGVKRISVYVSHRL